MGYWNRDLSDPQRGENAEPFRCWHDHCFPVYPPTTAEQFGPYGIGTTAEENAAHIFGGASLGSLADGMEHLIQLSTSSRYYADKIEATLTDRTRWTLAGYAWANWRMGGNCEACGEPC